MGERSVGRRVFLKLMAIFSGLLVLAQFIPVVRFLSSGGGSGYPRQRIASVKELEERGKIVFTYPRTGDPEKDSDPFRKFILFKMPNGEIKAYSMVCLHLWCLVDYVGERNTLECPCHGSIYRAEDGVAIRGPAALQPNKTLPEAILEVSDDGEIYATGVIGVIGYGKEGAKK
jgi:Rieske Fe-S protein